ncbi:restriction endonuclease [Nodularia sp. NIES-3585]|uniref:restriction endonuclease n=1 Tax=Nodularia sp. NIES-3585 TaxID=1973477 RepID=UPI000B5C6D56|nr:restriction endonuclease [Nodularia sp. NIES-3585]GAX34690.1 hypothetical protein NIES3585_06920 [Nodularia sp. NIES-3585]
MSLANKFNWNLINDHQFEEIVYEIVNAENPSKIEWRSFTGGKGRDIQAEFIIKGVFDEYISETRFIEAKHYQSGISATDITEALSWAMAEKPTVLVIASSSHLTNPCKEFINSWEKNNPNVRVKIWERKYLEGAILSKTATRQAAIRLGLLPPSINDLLPEMPDQARENSVYPAIAYRYLMTEEEISSIDDMKNFLQSVKEVIVDECDSNKYFEILELGIPNLSIRLSYLQAQIRLNIALLDYVFALENNASIKELEVLSEKIQEKIDEIKDDGQSQPRWLLVD